MTQTTKPPRLVILLNDGIIQNVYHDTYPIEYIIVDMDVKGFDTDRIATDSYGDEYLKAYPQLTMPTRNNYVKEIFDRAAAGYPEPRPHAEVIHAWAEGAEVEVLDPDTKEWVPSLKPEWWPELQYRVRGTNNPEVRVVATIGEIIDRPQLTPTEDKQMSWVPLDPGYPE